MTDSNEQHDTTDGRARDGGSPVRSARPHEGSSARGRFPSGAQASASGPSFRGVASPRGEGGRAASAHVTQEQPRYRFAPTWSSRAVRRDGRLRPSIRNAIGVEPGGRAACEASATASPRTGQVAVPNPAAETAGAGARSEEIGPRTGSTSVAGAASAATGRPGSPALGGHVGAPSSTGLAAAPAAAEAGGADGGEGATDATAGGVERRGRRRLPSRASLLVGAAVAAAVAVGGILGVGALTSAARNGAAAPAVVSASGGVVVGGRPAGSGDASAQSVAAASQQPPDLDVYVDYSSRDAATFSSVNDLPVHGYVQRGQVRLVVHPVVTDPSAPADAYAVRAGDAALCVAQHAPDKFWAYHLALLANLPTQRSNALSDAELVDLATATGVVDENVAACIAQGSYDEWLRESSRELLAAGVGPQHLPFDRQPLVVLDGAVYLGRNDNSTEFRGFVDAALGGPR